MKWEVKLYIAGQVFSEEVIARNHNDAKKTALARNPTATVVSVNAKFI
jgi:nucleoside 2-deoxyribosyltransferase